MAEVRLIDANVLGIDAERSFRDWPVIRGDIDRMINRQPTIDPKSLMPTGQWISVDGTKSCDEWDCTECKQRRTFMDEMELSDMLEIYPHCPNCGAKMEG